MTRASGAAAGDRRLGIDFNEQQIDGMLREFDQCHRPGVAVGVAIDGLPVYRKGFGLASVELPMVLTPSTRMRIGSTTKHFTAFLYMLLCEEGLASPDDPLSKFLPDLHPVTHRVTARQLMTNTSGLRDAADVRFQFSGTTGERTTRDDLVAMYRDFDDANTAPGTHWIYNNGGWVLLSALTERITGKPFEELMAERVFRAVGMHDSLVKSWDTDFVANSATSHSINRAGRLERLFWHQDYAGAGSIVSSIDDMLRWADNITRHRVGSPETWSLMTTAHHFPDGISTGYGLGLFDAKYRGVRVIHHPGGYTGAASQMIKVPEAQLDVVVLSNTDGINCTGLAYRIVDALLPNLEPRTGLDRPSVHGTFRSATTGRIVELLERDGHQVAAIDAGLDFPYEWSDRRSFKPLAESAHFQFEITLLDDESHPTRLRLTSFGRSEELVRAEPKPASSSVKIRGRYRSTTTGTEITIFESTGQVLLRSVGRFGTTESTLESLFEDVWRATSKGAVVPPAAILTFNETGFVFTNFTTWALPFRRIA